jgi:hypothetical protein
MLNAQCSIFKGEKELRLTGLERIIEEKKCHKDSKGKNVDNGKTELNHKARATLRFTMICFF